MDAAYRARAEARRARGMWGGVTRSHAALDDADLDYWLTVPANERVRAACLLWEEARALKTMPR